MQRCFVRVVTAEKQTKAIAMGVNTPFRDNQAEKIPMWHCFGGTRKPSLQDKHIVDGS